MSKNHYISSSPDENRPIAKKYQNCGGGGKTLTLPLYPRMNDYEIINIRIFIMITIIVIIIINIIIININVIVVFNIIPHA